MKTCFGWLAAVVCLSVLVITTGCGGGSPTPSSGPTPVPAVAVTSISPLTIAAGSPTATLTVSGSGFTNATVIQVGQAIEATTFVNSTQVKATIPAAQLAAGGMLPVVAINGSATSGAGTPVSLEVDNPAPTITQSIPAAGIAGASSASVSVMGTGFVPNTVINVGGSARSTAYVSSTQVNVALTSADLAAGGTLALAASNPTPGGGTSTTSNFPVNYPAPGPVIKLAPSVVLTGGSTPTTITVTGTNFFPASTVQVGGVSRATTYVSATQLAFQLSADEQASAAMLRVAVANPIPGGGVSIPAALNVATPTPKPVISAVTPSQFIVGSGDTTIAVSGTGITAPSAVIIGTGSSTASIIKWNGTALETSGYSSFGSSHLMAVVPASLLATTGTANITVSTPTAPSDSDPVSVSIVNPPAPTLTSVSPSAGPVNTDTPIALTGTDFTPNSSVSFNGTKLSITYVSSTSLSATLPASAIALPGNGSLTVSTPAPGGGTSAPLVFTAYIKIPNNSMVYNPANGLLYISVPGSAGMPYGNSVVPVDPATGVLGTPIFVGSEPNKLAITADGKYLWVGLDGASAVRKVDLTSNTAGLQFTLARSAGSYNNPPAAVALLALPGAPDSVVVASLNSTYQLAIYDSGVVRGNSTAPYCGSVCALLADETKGEIYAGSNSSYSIFTYDATGLKAKTSNSSITLGYSQDEMQIAAGRLYTDFGKVFDAESGSLLGTFYSSDTTPASGTTFVDTTLGKAFVVETPSSGNPVVQIFNTSDFNQDASTIPLSLGTSSYNAQPTRLTRWGSNGLAFRTSYGVFSLRSNLVKDLSTVSSDLAVALASSGSNTTGTNTTYVATITNNGPSDATSVALTAAIPSSGVLVSATPSVGTCSSSSGSVICNLGSLAKAATATVTFVATQNSAGSPKLTVQVSGSEADPDLTNNQATSTVTVTGSVYSMVPAISSISPAAVQAGASDTTITVTGSGFSSASSILLDGTALTTTLVSEAQLSATVPAAKLANLGWSAVSVSNPAPGGGTSSALPLTVYSVLDLDANHILYDPFSRNIMASVESGATQVTGNSIVAITPDTATIGTPVPIGSQPTNLALTSNGQILYVILSGNQSVARYNMLKQQADYTYQVPAPSNVYSMSISGIATQPGTENTIALNLGSYGGDAIYDFNPVAKTATIRGQASGFSSSSSSPAFLNATNLLDADSGALYDYTVTSAGFTYYNYSQRTTSLLNNFGSFQLSGGLAFANAGGVANPATTPATQLGVFPAPQNSSYSLVLQNVAPDASLQRAFFLTTAGGSSYGPNTLAAYDQTGFLLSALLPLDLATIEGTTSYNAVDLIRWGQDGLAALTDSGHIYLLRGPVVVPQLLNQNTAATLTASSADTISRGSGNVLLTLTGSSFVPGVAVTWNGSYRTTTIIDATHVTVAIPASDLASAGTASLVAVNPGAPASSALTVTIN